MAKLIAGDRIAYSAHHLQATAQQTGGAGSKRGTFLRLDPYIPNMARVRWDDEAQRIAEGEGYYAQADWVADLVANGSLVGANAIAKVGSDRFNWSEETPVRKTI
jgi:hypothetical protein